MKVIRVILRSTINLPNYRQASSLGDVKGDELTELESGAIQFTDGKAIFRFPESMISYIQYEPKEESKPEVKSVTETPCEPNRLKKPHPLKATR